MFRTGRIALCLALLTGCAATGDAPGANVASRAAIAQGGLPDLPSEARLIGLDGGELEGLLGRPTLVRSERQAQYWRYSLGLCQLDLFLYAEPTSVLSRVIYLDARPSGHAAPGEAAICSDLAALLRGEQVPPREVEHDDGQLPATEES